MKAPSFIVQNITSSHHSSTCTQLAATAHFPRSMSLPAPTSLVCACAAGAAQLDSSCCVPAQQRPKTAGLEQVAHAHGPLDRVGVALVELVAHWQRRPACAALCRGHARYCSWKNTHYITQAQLQHAHVRVLRMSSFHTAASRQLSCQSAILLHTTLPWLMHHLKSFAIEHAWINQYSAFQHEAERTRPSKICDGHSVAGHK